MANYAGINYESPNILTEMHSLIFDRKALQLDGSKLAFIFYKMLTKKKCSFNKNLVGHTRQT